MSFLCSLPLAASLFSLCAPPAPFATGYVEGEFTLVAPVAVAQVAEISVSRGDRVPAGVLLATMETRDAEIALAEADANLARAQSALTDLLQGARPEEINVIVANLSAAQARQAIRTIMERRNEARIGVCRGLQVSNRVRIGAGDGDLMKVNP